VFSFFRQKPIVNIPSLKIDLHSHLIPGIDDGSKSMEESIQLLKGLQDLGYEKVITTPHVMIDAYGNTKKSIEEALINVQTEMHTQCLSIKMETAAEYYLDEGLLPLVKSKDVLLVADTYLLFETSYTHRPQQLEEVIFEILSAGYVPLLAHPERYRYMKNDLCLYQNLKELGAEFQVNLNSFNGYYGSHAQKQARLLSKNGLIDFLGSDTHNIKHVKNLAHVLKSMDYSEIYRHNKIKNNGLIAN
jgi:tyrosine-protein phosphatase YwqE